jgi:hypothetical protein
LEQYHFIGRNIVTFAYSRDACKFSGRKTPDKILVRLLTKSAAK